MNGEMNLSQIEDDLKEHLDEKRYQHTVNVMLTAASLAMCHGEDLDKALLAGLLHDCTKYMTEDEHRSFCMEHGAELTDVEKENRHLLHARTGAIAAKERYGVEDEDILNAIRSHTTGRAGMSLLEKIIFVADYIEPGRKALEGIDEVRYLAFHDLDRCIHLISGHTLDYLRRSGSVIDPRTSETYQYYQ